MHDLAVYVKEGLPFAHDLSVENSVDSYLCFQLALLHSVFSFFFLYRQSPSSSLYMVFYSISSNIDEVLLINPSATVFVFGDFNVHHMDWLTYSGELTDLGNSVIIFLFQMTLLRWLNFLLRSLTVILTVLLFLIYYFLLTRFKAEQPLRGMELQAKKHKKDYRIQKICLERTYS